MLCAVIIAIIMKRRKRRRRNRTVWTRDWIKNRKRHGAYHHLLQELRVSDLASYSNFLRMDVSTFEELLRVTAPAITYQDTNKREAISPGERLAVTLRFLATGETYTSLQYIYRIPAQTIGKIIPETCLAITEALKEFLQVPRTEEEWVTIANNFDSQWQFPHCIGAMDGKHVLIKPPPNSGSFFFNYKHSFSIVLLALVDADYKFLYVDVGCNGRVADGGVFKNSTLFTALEENKLALPSPKPIVENGRPVSYMIVADDAFPLKEYLQKPYSQLGLTKQRRIYNYRLSRARRIVENAYGILSNRFRVFMSPIGLSPEKVEMIVIACCTLHNFLRSRSNNTYTPPGSLDTESDVTHAVTLGQWRHGPQPQGLIAIERQGSNHHSNAAKETRDYLCSYFNSDVGSVSWQDAMV